MTRQTILDRWEAVTALMGSGAQRRQPVSAATQSGTTEIYLYGPISRYGWFEDVVSAKSVVRTLKDVDTDRIDLHIHSPGGDVVEGIAILNALRNHPATITVHVDGIAASAASYVALCGEEIVMGLGAELMIHDASMVTFGKAADLAEDAEWLDKQSQNIAGLYAHRAGGTAEGWRELMKAETWYTAEEAVAAGLADRIATDADTDEEPQDVEVPTERPVEDAYDLRLFAHAGRSHAPAPTPPTASADGSTTTQEETAMAFTPEQIHTMRQELGLAENADEATIVAAMSEALAEQAEESPAAPTVPEGMALVEQTVLDELRAAGEEGRAARRQQLADHRDRTIAAAIESGRIAPARREHFEAIWTADPEGTEQLLNALEPGLVPVSELGHAGDTEPQESGYDDSALSNLADEFGITKEDLQ